MNGIKKRFARAFTLIEVLVVVAIIALLVAILIPSLKKAREQAKRTVCSAHMHQVMFGVHSYGNDHKGDGPMRGWFNYTVAEPKREAFGWGGSVDHVLINLGMLWKKWVGSQVDVLYCPATYQSNRDLVPPPGNSKGGWKYAFRPVSEAYWVYGGYTYGAILANRGENPKGQYWGKCPNFRGTNPYPPQVWSGYFKDTWVSNWETKTGQKFKMPVTPCLFADQWLHGFDPPHSEGKSVNVAFTDGHVRNQRTDKPITSGGYEEFDRWWYFSLQQ